MGLCALHAIILVSQLNLVWVPPAQLCWCLRWTRYVDVPLQNGSIVLRVFSYISCLFVCSQVQKPRCGCKGGRSANPFWSCLLHWDPWCCPGIWHGTTQNIIFYVLIWLGWYICGANESSLVFVWYYDVLSGAVACKEGLGVAECSRGIQYIELLWWINFVSHKLAKLSLRSESSLCICETWLVDCSCITKIINTSIQQ